jgi:protein-disulfide isomerase
MKKEVKILAAIAVVVIIAAIGGANYYRKSIQSESVTTGNNPNQPKINPEQLVRPDSPTLGAADAKVTIVEFLDPECESCAAFSPTIKKMLKEYDGKVRLVVRYMPLHPNSFSAATFTEAAGEQGKYWEAQEMLFQKQPEWGTKHGPQSGAPADINSLFKKYAMELGLDASKMDGAFAERRYIAKLERDKKDGQALGVRQTPTLFVNGRKLARLYESDLRSLIEEELSR